VAIAAPVPRPAHRFWRWSNRWVTLSRHPESSSGPLPYSLGEWGRNPRRTFRSPYPTAGFTYCRSLRARSPFTRPCNIFVLRGPSLFETRRRLTTSATAYRRAGNQTNDSRFLAGTVASTTFLFLRTTPLIAEQWRAASRAAFASADPGAGSSRLPRFAQPRCLQPRPTTLVLPIVHSEDQRARVEGPSEGCVPIRMRRCPVPASGSYA